MRITDNYYFLKMNDRKLSIIVFSLFFSWLLAFPFEGQVLYRLAEINSTDISLLVFSCIISHFFGLICSGIFIKTLLSAKRLILFSIAFCILTCIIFFFPPSVYWYIFLITASFFAGACVAGWGYFFKASTPAKERIITAADGLIYSNILMIVINFIAFYTSPYLGLGLSMIILGGAYAFAVKLPETAHLDIKPDLSKFPNAVSPIKPLFFLCLFIFVLTINSGIMYQVINPAFAELEWLASWYWAVPYIAALYIMRNLPRKANRSYILYVAIAMMGLSFIAFMTLGRSASSYLLINTLMLGAFGVYDLFWWSILGEMLEFDKNPAKILGIGLSANVFGVLFGGFLGNSIITNFYNSSIIALIIVFIILIILPLLNKQLIQLLKSHTFLAILTEMSPHEQIKVLDSFNIISNLTERESQIAMLLMKGKTYKSIAIELYISENTIKTHIKNIYSKLKIKSKAELIKIMMETEQANNKIS